MAGLNETPSGNRLHIGVFGKTNSGKSSFINRFSGQNISIVADVAGTATDPVYKAMEVYPLGPCTLIDTAGFNDETELGEERLEKTKLAAEKTDIAIILLTDTDMDEELHWYEYFREKKTSVIWVIGKADIRNDTEKINEKLYQQTGQHAVIVSAATGAGMDQVRKELVRNLPEQYGASSILGELVTKRDLVMLVMPQDIQAPKGRLILPQQQTIRDLLEAGAASIVVKETELEKTLEEIGKKPALVITDSQAFGKVSKIVPEDIKLTSFSILFARYKGDLEEEVRGVKALEHLEDGAKILIAEGCTHHRQCDEIGTVKIPRWLKQYTGKTFDVHTSSGNSFPDDLDTYDLVIHCGGCTLNRRELKNRIARVKDAWVPIVNYGIFIAATQGILKRTLEPFEEASRILNEI